VDPGENATAGAPGWRATLRWHWPLTIVFLGFPLWWVLGLRTILPMALSLVMADQLVRRRRVVLPSGSACWALFLTWVALGVFVLWADAPGAVPGGHASRLLVFGYRVAWYFTATMVMLWIANLRESELSERWLLQLVASMYVVATVGGLLGVIVPTLEFRSLVELAMPHGLRANSLVQSITHPAVADIQHVLGRPVPRPKAPFPFANSWGAMVALTLPFFLVAWWRDGARWQRILTPVVLVASTVPIVFSLNRGLWICLAVGAVGYLLLLLRRGSWAPVAATVSLLVAGTVAFLVSPLGTIFQERLAHAHSNERRGSLLTQTVISAATGSPIVGFGSTRDVQGSFASIAGADTPDCSACGVPPLGTQGHLWLVIFSQGLVGVVLFLAFFAIALSRSWRCRTTAETLCTFLLVFFAIQLFVYDTLGMPLITVMIAIGMVWREQVANGRQREGEHLASRSIRRLRAGLPLLGALAAVGAVAGAGMAVATPTAYVSRVSVVLDDTPSFLDLEATSASAVNSTDSSTVDTEAAMALSDDTLSRVLADADPATLDAFRSQVRVTAAPNTRVLTFEVRDRGKAASGRLATSLATEFLATRTDELVTRRRAALAFYAGQIAKLDAVASTRPAATVPDRVRLQQRLIARARRLVAAQAYDAVLESPTGAGRVIRTGTTHAARKQAELPVVSGIALGLALGSVVLACRPAWVGRRSGRRR
jgi:hypothetical protein